MLPKKAIPTTLPTQLSAPATVSSSSSSSSFHQLAPAPATLSTRPAVPANLSSESSALSNGSPSGPTPGREGQRARRQQISSACRACQLRKGKCDGQRPCKWCRDRKKPCIYEVEAGETRTGARKRKFEDLEQEHNALLELIDIAALRPDAGDILQQLKTGRAVQDLLGLLKEGDIAYQAHLGNRSRTRRMLLSLLIQSTASLDEIILTAPRIAEARLDIAWEAENDGTQALKNRTIGPEAIISAVEGISPFDTPLTAVDQLRPPGGHPFGKSRLVTNAFSVPAEPWTKLTTDDALVSHLVTVFLNYPNVYWRYVEEDLFLQSMQSGNITAEFCSPFLVNAICALACLSSEHGAVFNRPDDLISRGQHFHDEALRLWLLEGGKASITNIQALVICSMGSGFRGKDKLGLSLLAVAIQMNLDLPFSPASSETLTMSDATRARVCASWSAHLFDTTNSLGLLRPCKPIDPRLSFLPNLPENWRLWTGEPFLATNAYFRPNALMRERCQLLRLTCELVVLLFSPADSINAPATEKAVRALMTRMEHWYSLLPDDLQFQEDLPAPVYELHGHYHCALMTLRSSLDALQAIPTLPNTAMHSPTARQHVPLALKSVLESANFLKHFRQAYGFKSALAFIFQAAAVVSSILINYLGASLASSQDLAEAAKLQGDIETAFNESYRCLLAIGTRFMIGRGVARMVFHTSRTTNKTLPTGTQRLLEVVNDVVWNSTDVQQISSSFPNWGMQKSLTNAEEARMESLLKQWEDFTLDGNHAV